MIYYDSLNNRLVYTGHAATAEYWDKHWNIEEAHTLRRDLLHTDKNSFVSRVTRAYLKPKDGPILEGGCGAGYKLGSLCQNAFQAIGVDYAQKTVDTLNRIVPEIDVRHGDIRSLEFCDSYFAGYWSLGVIEHFWDGYAPIIHEMARVIRPGGYLFITFPWMNGFRSTKAWLKKFPELTESLDEPFYQFALDDRRVRKDLERIGFKLIERRFPDVIYGMTEEWGTLAAPMAAFSRIRSRNRVFKIFGFCFEQIMNILFGFFFSYTILLVMRKSNDSSKRCS